MTWREMNYLLPELVYIEGYMLMHFCARSENGLKTVLKWNSLKVLILSRRTYALHFLWKFTKLKAYYATHIFRPFSDRFQTVFRALISAKTVWKTVWMFQIVLRPSLKVHSTFIPVWGRELDTDLGRRRRKKMWTIIALRAEREKIFLLNSYTESVQLPH